MAAAAAGIMMVFCHFSAVYFFFFRLHCPAIVYTFVGIHFALPMEWLLPHFLHMNACFSLHSQTIPKGTFGSQFSAVGCAYTA
jgi:hypothetical protein